ncbi:MAG: Fic family protein [Chitinophagaceae bacterium]|nr:Fic family protein [Chitinophagaceae bacterium]
MVEIKNISNFFAGREVAQYQYKSFKPELIHYDWVIDNKELISLLSDADRALGSLNAYSELVPNVDFFVQMHITKEATTSSRIEGTQTNLEEALIKEEDVTPERRDDWEEVHNYIKAINFSIERLQQLPISNRLIKETHAVLMQGVRGEKKSPGEYRRSQNWIGATLRDAIYVPPYHEEIDHLMSDFENFLHDDQIHTPHLIRIGMLHYQFETIHPFLDGNGRMGRLLITLYLVSKGLLNKPALYLSDFFDHHRSFYYDYLHRVRTHHDMVQWLKFFLAGIIETAESSIQTFKDILTLKERIEGEVLPKLGRKQVAGVEIFKLLYKSPIINVKVLMKEAGMNYSAANRLIKDLVDLGILSEFHESKRNRMFFFDDYLKLFLSREPYKREKNS